MGGRSDHQEVQVGGQLARRRGDVDDHRVDAAVAETRGHGSSDLLGVAEHRLHDHEGGEAVPDGIGASTVSGVWVMGPGCGLTPHGRQRLQGRGSGTLVPPGAPLRLCCGSRRERTLAVGGTLPST